MDKKQLEESIALEIARQRVLGEQASQQPVMPVDLSWLNQTLEPEYTGPILPVMHPFALWNAFHTPPTAEGTMKALGKTGDFLYGIARSVLGLTGSEQMLKSIESRDPVGQALGLVDVLSAGVPGADDLLSAGVRGVAPMFGMAAGEKLGAFGAMKAKDLPEEIAANLKGTKVMDEAGNPATMYHWTNSPEDFSEFDTRGSRQLGAHFGTAEQANYRADFVENKRPWYKDGASGPGRIFPVYLDIKNPIELSDRDAWTFFNYGLPSDLVKKGVLTKKEVDAQKRWFESELKSLILKHKREEVAMRPEYWKKFKTDQDEAQYRAAKKELEARLDNWLQEKIIAKGYDGIAYKNNLDGGGGYSYIAFRPDQIISALSPGKSLPEEIADRLKDYYQKRKGTVKVVNSEAQPFYDEGKAFLPTKGKNRSSYRHEEGHHIFSTYLSDAQRAEINELADGIPDDVYFELVGHSKKNVYPQHVGEELWSNYVQGLHGPYPNETIEAFEGLGINEIWDSLPFSYKSKMATGGKSLPEEIAAKRLRGKK